MHYKAMLNYKAAVIKDILQTMQSAGRSYTEPELLKMIKEGFSHYWLQDHGVRQLFESLRH